jgi:hypothetical protein
VKCDGARGDVDRLQDEGSRLGETLQGVKSHVGLVKSSSHEVEVCLVQVGSKLAREHDATGGPPLA